MSSVEGVVCEFYTGRAVQGALVTADGFSTVTDWSGKFRLSNLPPKTYSVQVIHRDFEGAVLMLNLSVPRSYTVGTIKLMSIVRALGT